MYNCAIYAQVLQTSFWEFGTNTCPGFTNFILEIFLKAQKLNHYIMDPEKKQLNVNNIMFSNHFEKLCFLQP